MDITKTPTILLLKDGRQFLGFGVGVPGTVTGEICFNTGMTGYQEIYTDPSYFGQILVSTNAHIGNYGIKDDEIESDAVQIAGLVCKNYNIEPSRKKSSRDIQSYFESQGVVGISDVDTREIVRHIRSKGAMNAIISSEITDIGKLKERLMETPSMSGLELASEVSTMEPYEWQGLSGRYKVAVFDFGVKKNILKSLVERNCHVRVYPAKTDFEEVKAWKPDGYFLSNGPGDPSAMDYAVDTTKKILNENQPLFGICLGHQILARAVGIDTYKMHHGHRGINHPVKNLETGKCEITSQNHGFGVHPDDIKNSEVAIVTHVNLNDHTIEGIKIQGKKAFSVQYHPEASPGPHDARYLFDQFILSMN